MKKIIRSIIIVTSLIIVLSKNVYAGFDSIKPYGFWPIVEEMPANSYPVFESISSKINSLGKELVDFLNEEYKLNWKYATIPVFATYLQELKAGGYFSNDHAICFNTFILKDIAEEEWQLTTKWIIVHELFHAITDKNLGTPYFYKEMEDGSVLGMFLHEALAELITEEFFKEKDYANALQGREIEYYLKITRIVFPDAIKMLLNGKMDELEKEINTATDNSLFNKWLFVIDITQLTTLHGENYFICVKDMTEFLSSISKNKDKEIVEEFKKYFIYYGTEKEYDISSIQGILDVLENLAK